MQDLTILLFSSFLGSPKKYLRLTAIYYDTQACKNLSPIIKIFFFLFFDIFCHFRVFIY